MKTIVMGAGYFGRNYIRELSGNLVAVVEVDKARANSVRETFNVPVYDRIPNNMKFDAAIIATPPDSHVELALEVLKTGRKVLIEKPFALSMEEALKLRNYRNNVMVGMIYLYHPHIEKLKARCDTIPLVHAYSRRTNNGPVRPWQDATWDLATHDISIFNYIFDAIPHAMESMSERHWCMVRLIYPTVNALIYASWHGGPKIRRVELVPAELPNRIIFDDVATVLKVSPMRRMLDAFNSGEWDRCSFENGLEVLNVLGKLQ